MFAPLLRLYASAFSGLPRGAWLISGAMLVNRMGTMVVPFLTLYLHKIGFTYEDVGLLLGVAGIGGILGSYLGGKACDLFDARTIQIGTLIGSGLLLIALGHVHSKPLLFAGFLLFNLIGDAFRPASAVAIQTAVPPEARLQAAGLRRLAINLGVSIAPVVGGLLAVHDYLWLFWVDGLTSLAAAFVLWRFCPKVGGAFESADSAALRIQGRDSPWRDVPFLTSMMAVFGSAVVFMQVMSTLPLVLSEDYHLREDAIGLLLAINPVVIVAVEMVLMRSLRGYRPLPILGVGSICIGVGLGMLALGNTFWWAILPILVFTVGEMLSFPTAEAYTASRANERSRGAYLGVYSMAFGLASTCAALFGMMLYRHGGMELLWGACAFFGTLAGLVFFLLQHLEKKARAQSA